MKTVIKNKLFLGISAGLALVLLSGCGGGGSGSSGGVSIKDLDSEIGILNAKRVNTLNAVGTGSVIQSSANGKTAAVNDNDRLELSIGYDRQYSNGGLTLHAEYGSPQGGFTVTADTEDFRYFGRERAVIGSTTMEFSNYWHEDEDEGTYVDFYTNAEITTDINGENPAVDPNWLAGGFWLAYDEDDDTVHEVGAFFVSNNEDPYTHLEIQALTDTEATYLGGAYGWYIAWEDGDEYAGEFEGAVALTADFGGSTEYGSISGRVTEIYYDDEEDGWKRFDGHVDLGNAQINRVGSTEEHFFEGATSSDDGDGHTFTGAWGGQFAGNHDGGGATDNPEFVGGTFSGGCFDDNGDTTPGSSNGCDHGDYEATFLGIFVAGEDDDS